jgi:hypothetical protein
LKQTKKLQPPGAFEPLLALPVGQQVVVATAFTFN